MVIMSPLNQAALLLFLSTYGVFAGDHSVVHMNMLGYRGDSVTLACNKSDANTKQISWTKDRYIFTYSISRNQNSSNFSSDRVNIGINSPSQLIIINAQDDDEGLYTCNVTGTGGLSTIDWNLTVSERPAKEARSFWYLSKIVIPVTGVLLCCIIAAFCLCRKLRRKTPNANPAHSPNMQNMQTGTERNSHHMERINSIYNT